jgi:hypothetical protein
MRDDPAGWLRLTVRKAIAYVGNVELPNNEPYETYRSEYVSLRSIPLGFGALFGLFLVSLPLHLQLRRRLSRSKRATDRTRAGFILLMLVTVAVYSLTVIGFFVTGRYRVPMLPFFAIGAGVSAVSLCSLLRKRDFLKAALTVGAAVVIIAVLNMDHLHVRETTRGFAALTIAQDRLDTGDVDGAIAALEKIRREGSVRAPEVYLSLARAYLKRGSGQDRDAAFHVAEEGLRFYPDEPELLWYSAVGHIARRDWEAAAARLEKFLRFEPGNIRALYLAFDASVGLGDTERAQGFLDRASAVDGSHPLVGRMRDRLSQQAE